jgi:type VI secretion system VasD/TssJ family lipoprotein
MKKYIEIFLFLIPVLLACSCAPRLAVIPEWPYEKDAIRLHLKSDSRLNLYQGTSHALLLCVYQLRDPNTFNQLTEEREGLPKLCECGRFDPSVASSKRFVIQPGQELTESLNRAEGAKYVGIVAGYYALEKERVVRLLQIPVVEERKSLLSLAKTSKPGMLNIDLYLGPQEIRELREK